MLAALVFARIRGLGRYCLAVMVALCLVGESESADQFAAHDSQQVSRATAVLADARAADRSGQLPTANANAASHLGPTHEPLVPAAVPGPLRSRVQRTFLGGGQPERYTWHLSVVDGGRGRGERLSTVLPTNTAIEHPTWPEEKMNAGMWTYRGRGGKTQTLDFGNAAAIPIRGDFNGDGRMNLGAFRDGRWFIDLNGNERWDADDLYIRFGQPGDIPVVGDWNGDGKADIGVYGRGWANDETALAREQGLPDVGNQASTASSTGRSPAGKHPAALAHGSAATRSLQLTAHGLERVEPAHHTMQFGAVGDIPVVGDWNGDGVDNLGIFRRGRWVLDMDGDGRFSEADQAFDFGAETDLPVVGDFNGDGQIDLGLFRRGQWLIDLDGDHALGEGDLRVQLGTAGDRPVPGDYQGVGADQPAVYRAAAQQRP